MAKKVSVLVGIPTRNRGEYLSCLLSNILWQDRVLDNDRELCISVFIVDSSDNTLAVDHPQAMRFIQTLKAVGIDVQMEAIEQDRISNVVAVNKILLKAAERGMDFVFKIDDDHLLPPNTLRQLIQDIESLELPNRDPVLVSGVTPWMWPAFEGAVGPRDMRDTPEPPLLKVEVEGSRIKIESPPNHFFRYLDISRAIVPTVLAADANFMLRTDVRILWTEVSTHSHYCDVLWYMQLRSLLGYKFYFDVSLNLWHVAAPHGGTRAGSEGNFDKRTTDSKWKETAFALIAKQLGI